MLGRLKVAWPSVSDCVAGLYRTASINWPSPGTSRSTSIVAAAASSCGIYGGVPGNGYAEGDNEG